MTQKEVKRQELFLERAWRENVFLLYPHSTALEEEDISSAIPAGGCVCVNAHVCVFMYYTSVSML